MQVADISDVVRQRADALMLSGESAVGAFPEKALGVLRQVSTRIEEWCRSAALPVPRTTHAPERTATARIPNQGSLDPSPPGFAPSAGRFWDTGRPRSME